MKSERVAGPDATNLMKRIRRDESGYDESGPMEKPLWTPVIIREACRFRPVPACPSAV